MQKCITSALVVSLFMPFLASAATAAELQAQAQALLDQVTKLQAQVGGGDGTTPSNPAVANAAACPNIGRTLKLGSSGRDVTALQQYLAQDPAIYPEGTVSGYYGKLTQAAVQRWQAKYNIVSSGSPATTGYGMVGPRTAAAISLRCTQDGGTAGGVPVVGGFIEVTPISGNATLNVTVRATVNTVNSCTAAQYTLDFGDGTAVQQIPVAANTCQPIVQTFTHAYQYAGTFQIKLASGGHETSATVTVYGMTQQTQQAQAVVQPAPSPSAQPGTFTASGTAGAAPYVVTFSGIVPNRGCSGCSDALVFGDGSSTVVATPSSAGQTQPYSVGHTYSAPGTYTAVLYNGDGAPGQAAIGVITVKVSGYATGSGAYGIVSLAPGSNNNPMTVAAQFNVPNCGAYQIDWGDATPISTVSTSCDANPTGPQVVNISHTFTASGAYSIKLKDGNGNVQKTAGITIQ